MIFVERGWDPKFFSKEQSCQTVLRKTNMITYFPKGNLKHKKEGRRRGRRGEER